MLTYIFYYCIAYWIAYVLPIVSPIELPMYCLCIACQQALREVWPRAAYQLGADGGDIAGGGAWQRGGDIADGILERQMRSQ